MAAALYFDENVDIELALRLRADGYDVLTTREAGLLGSTDEQQLAFAAAAGRVFFTHDRRDILALTRRWSAEGRSHAGVVVASIQPPAFLRNSPTRLLDIYTAEDLKDVTLAIPLAG